MDAVVRWIENEEWKGYHVSVPDPFTLVDMVKDFARDEKLHLEYSFDDGNMWSTVCFEDHDD